MGRYGVTDDFLKSSLENFGSEPAPVSGIASGLDIDRLTGGFESGKLYLVGGRPSMGKSVFAYNLMIKLGVINGTATTIYSLEVPATIVVRRLVSIMAGIDYSRGRAGSLNGEEIEKIRLETQILNRTGIIIDDTRYGSLKKLNDCIKSHTDDATSKVIFVDYLQLLCGTGKFDESEIEDGLCALKSLAEEKGIAIVILSQLSGKLEKRKYRRPQIRDFRIPAEGLNQFDCIMGLYRDDYYDLESKEPGIMEVLCLRSIYGTSGVTRLDFNKENLQIKDIEKY